MKLSLNFFVNVGYIFCEGTELGYFLIEMSTPDDEFEQYRARSYSGGFSPSLRPRATSGKRPRSAAHRRGRRLDDQGASDDAADDDGLRQFTADRAACQHFIKPHPIRQTAVS